MVKTVATILSYGMGVESSAILLRWIMSPATRPCPLEDLIVITSQVGDEYTDTGRDVNTHILPLMGALGIRYVQVARHGHFGSAQETVKACPFIGFGLERFCPGALGCQRWSSGPQCFRAEGAVFDGSIPDSSNDGE